MSRYVVGVLVAWALVLGISWLVGGSEHFRTAALVCGGFFLGMIAMFIAVHFYEWK
jgi:hypothetical protein